MNSNAVIHLEGISKCYTLHSEKPTLVESINPFKKNPKFWALQNINLIINKGDRVGITGPNGVGKTTLLKIISGITKPTTGKIQVRGKIVSLIELTAGFQPELSGINNIYLNGMLLGMSKNEIGQSLAKIVAFADIGKFIHEPLYTYSSGMALRLGFSIAIHTNPSTLILDENISAGDNEFQKKIMLKIQELSQQQVTLVLVSHQFSVIRRYCKTVYTLDHGGIYPITWADFNRLEKKYAAE